MLCRLEMETTSRVFLFQSHRKVLPFEAPLEPISISFEVHGPVLPDEKKAITMIAQQSAHYNTCILSLCNFRLYFDCILTLH